jgi:glutaredoxin
MTARSRYLGFLLALGTAFSVPAEADIYTYVDENGVTGYVDDPDEIPPRYRSQASVALEVDEAARAREEAPAVEVFSTVWCGYCKKLKSFLEEQGIAYKELDIEKDPKAAAAFREIGGTGVPVSRVGGKIVRGYDPDGILEALKTA